MKIEKVNDNQIRCILTREDLEKRHIKLSELAYGTEKAKNLFREMMRAASYECGFEAEDLPLMIEAVPVSSETIILIITKVEYPEELDTRFSDFVADEYNDFDEYDGDLLYSDEESYTSEETRDGIASSANDILELFDSALDKLDEIVDNAAKAKKPVADVPIDITRMFVFRSLDNIITLSHNLNGFYDGVNSLYKNNKDNLYYLVISQSKHTPGDFNKVCNVLTEYGSQANLTVGGSSYMNEHFSSLIADNALQTLAEL